MAEKKGSFTLPGEAGYEKMTLEIAEKWGADVIRDSDGTELSSEITDAGYKIYSTVCVIRGHNDWAKKNMDKLQQVFLISEPITAVSDHLEIPLMERYFDQQFRVNDTVSSLRWWQVYDRTTETVISSDQWEYHENTGTVFIKYTVPWHIYTVSFLAWRIWEEISMYNHVTNHWDKEHLLQLDPRCPEVQEYLLGWMDRWCLEHPAADVVRFTSMFYNFAWIWGSDERNRYLFSDWASYDFTVSPLALERFKEIYGYSLTAEDFIHQGKLHVTHMPADKKKIDWMDFINDFLITFGKKLIDIVHSYGKKAYVFYDDSWIGIEPYNGRFHEFGFDGIIKCVFNGYESRLCSGVPAETHELRLHPYLFPTGVDGSSSFLEGGNPKEEAQRYWISIRRALLRGKIDRIGLGGYLHLVQGHPEFVEYITEIADEFRRIKALHNSGKPLVLRPRICVLHCWGRLRSWTLSGHFHETSMHDLIHINESLSGLPFDVSFIDFNDIRNGALKDFDVVINAGLQGNAWSGGDAWNDEGVLCALTEWVFHGGLFIGVNEPSATSGFQTCFRMAHILGVDKDNGDRVCHGRWSFTESSPADLLPAGCSIQINKSVFLTGSDTSVFLSRQGYPAVTAHRFGSGMGIYLASFRTTPENTRLLMNLILFGTGENLHQDFITDNLYTECAYFPASQTMVAINGSDTLQVCSVRTGKETVSFRLSPHGTEIRELC